MSRKSAKEDPKARKRKPVSAPPVIVNPAAREMLERAAEAAGLSVQQLADLVIEAGVQPPPSADGMTQRFTLNDLGERLWQSLQQVSKPDRALWFQGLVPTQRIALVVTLKDQGYRSEVIARELGMTIDEVVRTWNEHAAKLGSQVVGIRLETIAGQLMLASEKAIEMATQSGDHRAVWSIKKEFIEMLQAIGIVDRAIHTVEHKHSLTDETKAEIERLYELRQKQERRRLEIEEIKQAEVTGDEIPAEVMEDYDE